jgi:hypothetical protein
MDCSLSVVIGMTGFDTPEETWILASDYFESSADNTNRFAEFGIRFASHHNSIVVAHLVGLRK